MKTRQRFKMMVCLLGVFIGVIATAPWRLQAQSDTPSCRLGVDCENGTWGVSNETIAAYPTPNVTPIYANNNLLYDRAYRKVTNAVDFYTAPGGAIKSTLGSGFNYVTIIGEQSGYSQISEDTWVRSEMLSADVLVSSFAGVHLPDEPLPYPMAWILTHLRPARHPSGEYLRSGSLLLRYTLVNLYTSVEVDGWRWYQIGINQWVKQTHVAKLIPVERSTEIDTERWVSIDLYEQVLIAYEDAKPVFATLISSGLAAWSTREGLFHVYVRFPRTLMSGGGVDDFYYLEEVPWTMYFDKDIAVHGTYWHDGFGYRHSHGCVNASITDAHWLYNWASPEFDFSVANDKGPAIYVYSSGVYR